MLERRLRVVNPLGLHARAAARLVRTAAGFESRIELIHTDTDASADAKSILDVLQLAAVRDVELRVVASGPDEDEAVAAIESLIAEGLGEI